MEPDSDLIRALRECTNIDRVADSKERGYLIDQVALYADELGDERAALGLKRLMRLLGDSRVP